MLKSGGDGGHFTCYAVRMRMLVLLLALVIVHSVSSLPRTPLAFYTLLEWPDVVDMVSPFLLMACYWQLLLVTIYHLFKIKLELALRLMFLFSIISVLFALGHGMHNGSNAVGHLIPFKEHEALAHWHDLVQREQGRGDSTIATTIGHATPSTFASSSGGGGGSSSHSNNNNNAALVRVFWLSFLYDEQLGHMISHAAWIAWDVLLLVLHLRILFPEHRSSAVRDTDRTLTINTNNSDHDINHLHRRNMRIFIDARMTMAVCTMAMRAVARSRARMVIATSPAPRSTTRTNTRPTSTSPVIR